MPYQHESRRAGIRADKTQVPRPARADDHQPVNEKDVPTMSHTPFSQLRKRLPGGTGGSRPAHRKLPSARPRIEALEARLVPTVNVMNNFDGLISGAPPDTCGAAGPSSYVETVNSSVTIFRKDGTTIDSKSLSDFLFTQGQIKKVGALEDATMAYRSPRRKPTPFRGGMKASGLCRIDLTNNTRIRTIPIWVKHIGVRKLASS
jgi:hypothetical protein